MGRERRGLLLSIGKFDLAVLYMYGGRAVGTLPSADDADYPPMSSLTEHRSAEVRPSQPYPSSNTASMVPTEGFSSNLSGGLARA